MQIKAGIMLSFSPKFRLGICL